MNERFTNKVLGSVPEPLRARLINAFPNENPIKRRLVERVFHHEKAAALAAYWIFNGRGGEARRNYAPPLIERSVGFNYLAWPRKIRQYITGRSVLDVGCGTGLHAIGYIVVGASSYTGIDPKIALDRDLGKNLRTGSWEHFGFSPRQIMARVPRVRLIPGTFEQIAPAEQFQLIVLHNVTEHLINIAEVFEGLAPRLTSDGMLLFHHHNFYCWNGHHHEPKVVDRIDPSDPEQQHYVDWNHLSFEPPPGHYFVHGLNRIRLDELRSLTERFFDIEEWHERASDTRHGKNRLTPEIRAHHRQYSERDLSIQNVLCIARPKPSRIT